MIEMRRVKLIFFRFNSFRFIVIVSSYVGSIKVESMRAAFFRIISLRKKILFWTVFVCLCGCEKPPSETIKSQLDWSGYEKVLKHHVTEAVRSGINVNLVDYRILRKNSNFMNIANLLAKTEVEFSGDNDKLAFYINAYNYYAIKIIIDNDPSDSIRDIGNVVLPVWQRTVGRIAGKDVSLDFIEHKILRTMGEPRVHFAIVCASLSCPNLRQELYTAKKLEYQLDDQARKFLNDETKGVLMGDGTLHISRIFDWFEEDFEKDGGVLPFIRRYREGINAVSEYDFIGYRWELNALEQ